MEEERVFIREAFVQYGKPKMSVPKIINPIEAMRFWKGVVKDHSKEHFATIYFDQRRRPIGYVIVSIGTAAQSLVHPREVFQIPLKEGACAVILAHNHPSGEVTPSLEDITVTERLSKAAKIIGISLIDHIIWSHQNDEHYSMRAEHPQYFS